MEKNFSSYSEFGRKIGKSRQNIQTQIFQKKSLNTETLVNLSNTLGVNLFEVYKDMDETVINSKDKTKITLNFQVELSPDEWKSLGLLDKIKEL